MVQPGAMLPYSSRLAVEWLHDAPALRHRRITGTLAFCDLSGFTAMSERLASLGRLGAEELSEVINRIFGALLADSARFGGSMLKYGGDAVLVFFSGDGHAVRAAAAAIAMQATLRDVGRAETSRGTVRVRMSCGVNTGDFDFFLVGSTHRELLVTGPAATATCALEAAASAGEVLVSPAMADALPARCLGQSRGDAILLRGSPGAPEVDVDAPPSAPHLVDYEQLVPEALRRHLESGVAEPEHRHATVAFVAFSGTDEIVASAPEEATEMLERLVARIQEASARYGVSFLNTDVYGDGGKAILTAGVPASYEDNDERVLRAVRDLFDSEDRIPLHAGIHRGYVFAGDVGPDFRRAYTVLGDAVNTAARVMASCGHAVEIRVSPDVLDRASSTFAVERRPPFVAKGKSKPLETFAVGARQGSRGEPTMVAFVDRDAERRALREVIRTARTSESPVVAVVGPAGVGKSRLVGEVVSTGEGPYVWARADAFEHDVPYAVVRAIAAAARVEFPRVPTDEEASDALAEVLTGVGVVVVDDADHIDDPSLDTLRGALAGFAAAGAVLVVIGRQASSVVEAPLTVGVEPLPAEAAALLARAVHPSLLPGEARRLAERSGGNALFLLELARAAERGERLADTVETAVAEHIDALTLSDRSLLRTAAVLGDRFDVGELREIAALDRTPDLSALRDFLTARDNTVAFRQAMFREVAYAGLTYRRRRALHLAAGRSIEAVHPDPDAVADVLSRHFHAARDWERAWRYALTAGRRAYTTTYKATAAAHLGRAVDAASHLHPPPDGFVGAIADWGQALYYAGRHDDALAAYRRARRAARGDDLVTADLLVREAALLNEIGDVDAAGRRFARARRILAAYPPEVAASTRVSCLGGLLTVRAQQGRSASAAALADEVSAAAAHGETADRARALAMASYALRLTGRPLRAAALASEAVDAFGEAGFVGSRAEAIDNLGMCHLLAGRPADAVAAHTEARLAADAAGNEVSALFAAVNLAAALVKQGKAAEASALITAVLPALRRVGDMPYAYGLMERAKAAVASGAEVSDDDLACIRATATVTPGMEPDVLALEAEVAIARGEGASAMRLLAEADLLNSHDTGSLIVGPLFVAALVGTGRGDDALDAARALAVRAVETSTAERNPLLAAYGLTFLGRLDEAEPLLDEAGVVALPPWVKPISLS